MEEEASEIAATPESTEILTDVFFDPRIAELEKEVHQLKETNLSLQRNISVANSLIERLRIAKNGYKKVAAQGIQEVQYMNKYAPHNYITRRASEFPAEFNAVADVD